MKSMSLKRLGSFSRKLTAAALLYSAWTTVVPGLAHGEEVIAVFDPVDSTDEIKAAIRSAGVGGTVIIPNVGETWFVSDTGGFNAAIALNKDNMTLVLEEGVRIQALTNAEFFATQSRRLIVVPANGCRIIGEGSGATVAMNRDLYIANDIPDDDIELGFRHAVRVGGVDGFEIRNLTIEGSGGDGIQLGDFYTGLEPSDILIQDVNVVDATRNGMALTSGSNVLVDGCMVTGTSGAFPRAGIDVEVDKGKPASVIEGMRIENTIVMDNEGSGFQVGLFNYYTTEGEPVADVDLHIRNCTSIGNGDFGVRLTATRSGFELGGPGGEIVLEDVLVSESEENGTRISGFVPGISPRIQFRGVVWDNVATSDPLLSPILFRGIRPGFPIGGVDFLSSSTGRCRIIDPNFERAALEQDEDIYDRPNSRRGIEDIQGEIEFVSASDQFLDFGPEEQAIDIGVQRVFGATNLVGNGGFEDGLDGWVSRTENVALTNAQASEGSSSVRITRNGGSVRSEAVGVEPGQFYNFSADARIRDEDDTLILGVRWFDADGTRIAVDRLRVTTLTWSNYAETYQAPENATTAHVFAGRQTGQAKNAFVDAFSFQGAN